MSVGGDQLTMSTVESEDATSSWCHHWSYRYIFLFFICFIRIVSNYCLELPSGLEDTIIKVMGVTTAEYDLLFSVSAWPNIVLCLVGGLLIDKLLGLRLGLLIVVSSVLLGQTVCAVGGFIDNYIVMLVGRFFIGAGNELTVVVGHAFKALWFKEDLPLAVSIDIAFGRLGGMLSIILPQYIYSSLASYFTVPTTRLGATLFTAAGCSFIGLLSSIVVVLMDWNREKKSRNKNGHGKGNQSLTLKGLKQFSLSYWLLIIYNFSSLSLLYSFVSIAQVYYVQKYGFSIGKANIANSLQFGSSVILVPIGGMLASRTGFYINWIIISVIPTIISFLMFMFSYRESFVPFVAGIFNSLAYTIGGSPYTSLIALLIDKQYITTAYGISRGSFNLSLAILVYATGFIIDNFGYFILEGIFVLLSSLCLNALFLIVFIDITSDKPKLNVPGPWLSCENESRSNNKPLQEDKESKKE